MQKFVDFFKKVPSWALMLVMFVALLLRDLCGNLTVSHTLLADLIAEMTTMMPEVAPAFAEFAKLEWLFWIVQSAIYVLLFELISSAILSMAMGRRALLRNKAEIMHDFRLFYVLATLVVAVLSPIMLALPIAYAFYWMELIKIPIYTATYILFYWFVGKNSIVYGLKSFIWRLVAMLVGTYFVASGVFDLMSVVTATERLTADLVMSILILVFAVLSAGAMLYFYSVVKKNEIANPPPPPPEVEEAEKVEIFKGFGF